MKRIFTHLCCFANRTVNNSTERVSIQCLFYFIVLLFCRFPHVFDLIVIEPFMVAQCEVQTSVFKFLSAEGDPSNGQTNVFTYQFIKQFNRNVFSNN